MLVEQRCLQHPAPGHDSLETMTQQDYRHPIAPPPELVQQWYDQAKQDPCGPINWVAVRAAQWGADKELEACLRLVEINAGEDAYDFARYIRSARRPKPPSLKEQALEAHNRMMAGEETQDDWSIVRRALEQLDD
jgi:hypothetical protein